MTRVLHTGDTHIGYRQYHSPERRADFLAAFRHVVDDAIADGVDAVVHAGDLFHDRRPALGDIHGTIEVLRDLREADIRLYAVVGNHERTRGQQWLDLFETLGLATRLGREPHVVGDVALYGLDYVPRSRRDALTYDFAPNDAEYSALVAHGLFEPFPHADWDTRAVLDAATIDFEAMLLGDNHDPGTETVADTWVTYCGSTERVDATEREPRGYNLVTFDGAVRFARRGIETRPFVTIDLELGPDEGPDRVRDRIAEEDVEEAVIVVTISGEGEPVSAAEVETFARERGALIARVMDRREFEAAEVGTVRFTDPDQAVRKRVHELGLSDAAIAIDELVRDDSVAKSNLRDRVQSHVRDRLEDDPEAFEPAAVDDPTPEAVAASLGVGDGSSIDETEDQAPEAVAESATGGDDPPPASPTDSDVTEARASSGPESKPDGQVGNDDGSSADDSSGRSESDRQVTMEDYL